MPGTLDLKSAMFFFYKKLGPTEDENIIYVALNLRYFSLDRESLLQLERYQTLYSIIVIPLQLTYRKVESSNTSRLEAHAGFSKLLMKGICDPYVL